MNRHKYYRVREIKNNKGEIVFYVEACQTWIEKFLGVWTEYTKKNETIEEAEDHIKSLVSWKVVSDKTVYKKTVK
jgi:hypothetical protein